MSTLEPTSRCAVCATGDALEQHHLALRSGCETAIVPLCPRCHDGQTDRQRRAGLIKRSPRGHKTEGLDLLCGLVDGLAGILTAHARHIGDDRLVHEDERQRRATLRLLSVLSGERPGSLGPRPISNDRLGDIAHRREVPAGEAGCTSAQSIAALAAGVLPALAAAIGELTGDSEVTRAASAIAAGSAQLAKALHALEDHPRADEPQSRGAPRKHDVA